MSRARFSNDKYSFVFGVNHTPMGCFFQVWELAAEGELPDQDDTDMPQVEADEMYGLSVSNTRTLERNPALKRALEKLSKSSKYLRNEETIIDIGKSLGFYVSKMVYELWD